MDYKATISDIFSSRKNTFAVPNYQRAYSWEVGTEKDKEVPQFLQDLKDHPDSVPNYHLGHFLFEQDKVDKNRFWVIDGQQRMTTVVIFMSCIYHKLKATNQKDSIAFNLYNNFLQNTDGQQKFCTVEYDNNYFINLLIENRPDEVKTRSRKKLFEARAYFNDEINKADPLELLKWKDLIENAKITTDTIEDKAEATQVFTFQNDRGKDLTNLEKLKAFLMLQVYLSCKQSEHNPNTEIRFVEKEFESIYECLEKIDIASEDQILNYHATAFFSLADTAINRFKQAFVKEPASDRQNWIRDLSVSLKQSYERTIKIQNLVNQYSYIPDILYLDQPNSFPLLLKLFHYHPNIDPNHENLKLMEIILFRLKYTVGNYYTNYLSNIALAFNGDLDQLKEKLMGYAKYGFKNYWNFEADFTRYLNGDNHYFSLTRYLLWKYENHLRKDIREPPMLYPEFSNLYGTLKFENTIDHWAPQNPADQEYDQEFKEKYLHNIGNMVLSTRGRNSSDNNKLPNERDTASVLISRQRLEGARQKWGMTEIKARQNLIVEFAIKYWHPEKYNQ